MTEHIKQITDYRFGRIEIDNRSYTDDVIIFGNEVISNWRRKKGHRLDIDDLAKVHLDNVTYFIIGTGYYGMMTVNPSLMDYCHKHGITLETMRTPEAIEHFNACCDKENLIGAFHLGC